MKRILSILFFTIGLQSYGQLPTIHPGTVTIGTVPEATATDSILTINENGLIGHIPKSEVETQLISVDEGNGPGWRLKGYDPNRFRNIGLNTIDLTVLADSQLDTNYGARGDYSVSIGQANKVQNARSVALGSSNEVVGNNNNYAFGGNNTVSGWAGNTAIGILNNITQGYGSVAIGSYNTVNHNVNGFGAAIGHNNVLSDIGSSAFGMALISKSRNTVAIGVANTDYPETGNNAARPILVVGTGTTTTPSGPWNASTRRDGFIVRHNGHVEAPDLTTAKIDAGVPRTLVTKEWVAANAGGTPTLQEVLTEGNYTDTPLIVGLNSSSGGFDWKMRYERDGITFREQGIEGSKATTLVFPEMAGIPGSFENWQALLNLPELGNGEEETIATREWVQANAGGIDSLQSVLDVNNEAFGQVILKEELFFGSETATLSLSGSGVSNSFLVSTGGFSLNANGLTLNSDDDSHQIDIQNTLGQISYSNYTDISVNLLFSDLTTPNTGNFYFPVKSGGNFIIATEDFIETEISEITAKGANFNTQYFYANGGSYQASGVSDLLTSFLVGNNTFSLSDRSDEAIYEGTLYFRYTPDTGSTTGITFSFAGDDYLIDTLTVEGGTYQIEIDYTLIFSTSPDTYTLILTAKRFNPDLSVAYNSYVDDYVNVSYTNSGNIDLDITINKNDAISEVRVYKAELKRVN